MLGFILCKQPPFGFQNAPSSNCWNEHKFITSTLSFKVSIWKRYADLRYDLPSKLLQRMVNFSERVEVAYVGAKTYHKFFEALFLKPGEQFDSLKYGIMLLVADRLSTGDMLRLVWIPWIMQGYVPRGQELRDIWYEDNLVNGTVCDNAERIIFAAHAFYITTITTSCVLGWCLLRLGQSMEFRNIRTIGGEILAPLQKFGDKWRSIRIYITRARTADQGDIEMR